MQHNIDATLDAYDLKNIKTVDLTIKLDATEDIDTWGTQKHFENIPVWDREYILDSYKQLQEIRPYYKFLSVDEDRYFILDHTRQVNLAAREINISKLPTRSAKLGKHPLALYPRLWRCCHPGCTGCR